MFKLTYGLFILTVEEEGKAKGCIINTAAQVTVEPNRIMITVNKMNYTHDILLENGKFNISIIDKRAEFELFKRFGFQTGREVDKFVDYAQYELAPNNVVYITESTNAYISAEVVQRIDLGTHTLFVADVTDMMILSDMPSVTYEYYQNHIKPQPAVDSDVGNDKCVWKCNVCGYEYKGEELPSDYICPICKHPASDFEKVV